MTVLRDLPRFRYLWLSKAISSTGTGVGRIALVLFVASSGPGAVSLVLIGTALPLVASPLAGAVADRVDQRRMLAGCEAGQGVVYAILAVTRPPIPVLLPLVILVRRSLHGPAIEYGTISAAFGAGMIAASIALTVKANRKPAAFWLIGGVVAGAAGTALTGIAPSAAVACVAQAVAGAGNTAELVGTDTLVQERVPAHMLGRAFGIVYGGAQLASALSYIIAAPLVALTGPRATFVIAGAGALLGVCVLAPAPRPRPAPAG